MKRGCLREVVAHRGSTVSLERHGDRPTDPTESKMMVRSLSIKPLSQISPKTPLSIKLPSPSNVLEIDTPPPPTPGLSEDF